MAGLINWKKASIPAASPDADHVFVGVDSSDGNFYVKNSLGDVEKFPTTPQIEAIVDTALDDYDTSAEVDAKIATIPSSSKFYSQFINVGEMSFTNYLFSWNHSRSDFDRRSGNLSNGFQFDGASPIIVPLSGFIKKAIVRIKGVAQSSGSPAATMTLRFELWSVGVSGQGTKIGDVNFIFNSADYTIGNFGNTSITTDFRESASLNLAVSEGDLIGVKFISQTGNANVNNIRNVAMILETE